MSRVMARRGIDANGVTLHAVNQARDALADVLYQERPDLQQLDQGYAKLADEQRSVNRLLPIVQRSRATYAANKGIGGSPSLPPLSTRSAATAAIDAILSPKISPAVANARAATLMTPGTTVQSLLDAAPYSSVAGRAALAAGKGVRAGIATSLPSALRGLLFPQQDDEQQQQQP